MLRGLRSIFSRHLAEIIIATLALTGLVVMIYVDRVTPSISSPIEVVQRNNAWTTLILLGLFCSYILIQSIGKINNDRDRSPQQPQDLNNRLKTLTDALAEAARIVSAIETEVKSREQLVNKLEQQMKLAEQAISLSKEQVAAVSALLSEQVAKQSQKDERRDLVKDMLFFIAGILLTLLLSSIGR